MDLGRARAKLETDPAGAQELIQQAHAGAKEAIVELRNLARGIYPAILTDRGLDAAISSVAARAQVPVAVEVDLPTRPPAAVESIAYFIVSEALTNVSKYARATRRPCASRRDQNWIVVEISDNGVGGASATAGRRPGRPGRPRGRHRRHPHRQQPARRPHGRPGGPAIRLVNRLVTKRTPGDPPGVPGFPDVPVLPRIPLRWALCGS